MDQIINCNFSYFILYLVENRYLPAKFKHNLSLIALIFILISIIVLQSTSLLNPKDYNPLAPSSNGFTISPNSSFPISPASPPPSNSLVPALFVIGDSTVDCGTNNLLGTFARAHHLPYCRDFDWKVL
ncbi:hypothetical protein SDJN02_05188, partial [Cucurbita argyrosperma subsp. argyrosperma]